MDVLAVVVAVAVVDAAAVAVAPVVESTDSGIICLLHVMCVQHVS